MHRKLLNDRNETVNLYKKNGKKREKYKDLLCYLQDIKNSELILQLVIW